MAQFYPLTVTDIRHTIRDAVVLTLKPKDPEKFHFTQGQYLTFKRDFGGTEIRRNYSICSGLDDGVLQVGIKQVDGGAFSSFANSELRVGEQLEALPPAGRFFTKIDPNMGKNYLGFAGGSGITPVLSILRTILTREPRSNFTLVYANRAVNTIMFRDELEDLKNHYMGRLSVIHILESGQDVDLFTGRVDAQKCARLFEHWIDVKKVDTAFICGPEPMMLSIADSLKRHGLETDQIKYELFGAPQHGRLAQQKRQMKMATDARTQAQVTVEGVTTRFTMTRDQSVLEAVLAQNLDAPFSCRAGVCSTCKARVTSGIYEMASNHALEDYEVEQGFVLTCQCYPLGDEISLEYDSH